MKRSASVFLLCLAWAFLSTTARAQTVTGNLDGHITDPAGGAVPGAALYRIVRGPLRLREQPAIRTGISSG
jgi:hypothetical protein